MHSVDPAGYRELPLGIDLPVVKGLVFFGNGPSEAGSSPGDGVLVDVGLYGTTGSLFDLSRGGKVGKPLSQVDGVVLHGQARHVANDRFREAGGFVADSGS